MAACSSFSLVWRNISRVGAINAVSGALLFMGELCTAVLTTGVCGGIDDLVLPRIDEAGVSEF